MKKPPFGSGAGHRPARGAASPVARLRLGPWWGRYCAAASLLVLGLPHYLSAQLPRFSLEEPQLELGGEAMPFHRVTGGALLSDGSVAVADAGNHRIALFGSDGRLARSLGGQGRGPGEFQSIGKLAVLSDTLVAFDPILRRLSIWLPEGELLGTSRLPGYGDHTTTLRDVFSSSRWLLTTEEFPTGVDHGVFTQHTSLLLFDERVGEVRALDRRRLGYRYLYIEGGGRTVYPMPFFGGVGIAGFPGGYALAPLDGAHVELVVTDDGTVSVIELPIDRKPFEESLIRSHRDSLLALDGVRANPASERRIREAYGNLPTPRYAPAVGRVLPIGGELWIEQARRAEDSEGTWYILDPLRRTLKGVVSIPENSTPLDGDGERVVLRETDEWGVETVVVRPLVLQDDANSPR